MPSRLAVLLLAILVVSGCRSRTAPPPVTPPGSAGTTPVEVTAKPARADAEAQIPLYPEDARWGADTAPVTIVAVTDLQCPFCARAEETLEQLRKQYGPAALRIVVKHAPLPFHPLATPAALAAMGVQRAAGDEAFFRFVSTVYAHREEMTEEKLAEWAHDAARTGSPHPSPLPLEEQLRRDQAFAATHGATGTPTFFVNGLLVPGAQPLENFRTIINAELAAIEDAKNAGKPVDYASRVAANLEANPLPKPRDQQPDPPDLTVWKVPIGRSPVLGSSDALVTLIEFSDYECPYCKRVEQTVEALRKKYGTDLRIVLKQNPLSFHPHARPAAEVALEALAERGPDAFFAVSRALFDAEPDEMDEDGLVRIATEAGLDAAKVRAALRGGTHDAEIQADQDVAEDFEARGTPCFFVNGRRLSGARPIEDFSALIDEQLAVARMVVDRGVPRAKIYDLILEHGEDPPPPRVVDLGPLPKTAPARGPSSAKVLVHAFSDFQCPFCKRVEPTLVALQGEFPRDVRVVWHDLPLDFHPRARAAANAAREAKARGGDALFWKMHDLVFESQQDLSDDRLAALGQQVGVPRDAVLAAISSGRHDAAIDADVSLASRAGIRGTPGFVINGYVVSGAQPLAAFRRAVRRALADLKSGVVPKPTPPDDPDSD